MRKTPFLPFRCSLMRGHVSRVANGCVDVYYLLNEIVAEKAEYFILDFLESGRVSSVYRYQRCVGCKGVLERGVP